MTHRSSRPVSWAYGVTTVPERLGTTLPRTLSSLRLAGFPGPHVFVDGPASPPYNGSVAGLPSFRSGRLGAWGNWWLTVHELYIRYPKADLYAIFQDDVLAVRNLRGYLEETVAPGSRAYFNLYTAPSNDSTVVAEFRRGGGKVGWMPAEVPGRGALGLVFPNAALRLLLASPLAVEKPNDARWPTHGVDGTVFDALSTHRVIEYIHHPSPLQHQESESTLPRRLTHPLSPSFPGEDADALSWLSDHRPDAADGLVLRPASRQLTKHPAPRRAAEGESRPPAPAARGVPRGTHG